MTLDQIDTPVALAKRMIDAACSFRPSIIADFSAGGGALLACAEERWPYASIIGVDVCGGRVKALRKSKPGWHLGCADFIRARSRSNCRVLNGKEGKVSLVLLNPPFSCRGAKTVGVEVGGNVVAGSLAMGFVLNSLPFLAPDGEIVAVLPAGVLMSEKDRVAFDILNQCYSHQIIERCDRKSFKGCSVRTIIVRIWRQRGFSLVQSREDALFQGGTGLAVQIIRGGIQMHNASGVSDAAGIPLVHTTELLDNQLRPSSLRVNKQYGVQGPMVLIPRVGEPSSRKLVLVSQACRIALSDCVFALKCIRGSHAAYLYSVLRENWSSLSLLYGGSCARYLTMRTLSNFLSERGFQVSLKGISSSGQSEVALGGSQRLVASS